MATATQLYYYDSDGNRLGPVTMSQIRALVRDGAILPQTTMELADGSWIEAKQIRGLFTESVFAAVDDQFDPAADERKSEERAAENDSVGNDPTQRMEEGTVKPDQSSGSNGDVYGVSTMPEQPRLWPPSAQMRSPRPEPPHAEESRGKAPQKKVSLQKDHSSGANPPSDEEDPFDRTVSPAGQSSSAGEPTVFVAWLAASFFLFALTAFATFLFVIDCLLPFPKWLSVLHCLAVMTILLAVSCVGLVVPATVWSKHRSEIPQLIPNAKKMFLLLWEPLKAGFKKLKKRLMKP